MIKGKLVAFNGAGQPLEVTEYPVGLVGKGEILVRNLYTTLCGSDIHTYCGLRSEICPTVLGHEIVGEIIEIDNSHPALDLCGERLQKGDRITWSIFSSNPDSKYAQRGIPQKGENLFKYGHALLQTSDAFHGGLSEYCKLRANTGILKIPSSLPIPLAATINCAMATVAGSIRMAGELRDRNVLIFGMGLLGIACVTMCREAGAAWIGTADISEKRLANSIRFGADEMFNISGQNSLKSAVREKSGNKDIDVVFDMSGAPEAMETGIDLLTVGGNAIWVGAVFRNRKIQIDAEKIIRNLITIKGLHNYNYDDLKYALIFLQNNHHKYPFGTIIEKEFSLQDAEQAFAYAVDNKPLRVGIRIQETGQYR